MKQKVLYFLWGASLIGISFFSDYSITKSVGDINFDIATMLTPAALIQRLILAKDNYLYEYYFQETTARNLLYDNGSLLVSFLAFLTMSFYMLWTQRKNG